MVTTTNTAATRTPRVGPSASSSEAPAESAPRRLRLGFLTHLHVGADAADSYRIALDLFTTAEQLGFDSGWVAQHHFLNGGGRVPSTLTLPAPAPRRPPRVR